MNKQVKRIAVFTLPLFIWVSSMFTNDVYASGHYRIGTLNESIHYRNNDEFNSTHDGIYIAHEKNVIGTYNNSESEPSVFFARNHPINRTFSYSYGVVLGYEFGLVPMLALSAQVGIVKFTFTHEAAVVGLEFEVF